MVFRKANANDLSNVRSTFKEIIKNMAKQNINIWDDIYPSVIFAEDVEKERLYLLLDGETVVAAFALCESLMSPKCVEWKDNGGKAMYLYRLAVNVDCLCRGFGELMIKRSAETAKALGADYLRLFVVDFNTPAIKLYEKLGFNRLAGLHDECVGDGLVLKEYAYELELN